MPRLIPDSECVQSKCARKTSGCWDECEMRRSPAMYGLPTPGAYTVTLASPVQGTAKGHMIFGPDHVQGAAIHRHIPLQEERELFQGAASSASGETTNHSEAYELACLKRGESNLARCYLELREAKGAAVAAGLTAEVIRETMIKHFGWLGAVSWADDIKAMTADLLAALATPVQADDQAPAILGVLTEEHAQAIREVFAVPDLSGGVRAADVMPPMRGTDGQHDAGASALSEKRIGELWLTVCRIKHATNRQIAFARAVEAELASRCRVQGGSTNNNGTGINSCARTAEGEARYAATDDDLTILTLGIQQLEGLAAGTIAALGSENLLKPSALKKATMADTKRVLSYVLPNLKSLHAKLDAAHPAPKGGDK
jgi:hypothetical protein